MLLGGKCPIDPIRKKYIQEASVLFRLEKRYGPEPIGATGNSFETVFW